MTSSDCTRLKKCEHCQNDFIPKSSPQQRFCSVSCVNQWRSTSLDYFWSKVCMRGPEDCWEWNGSKDKDGYGKIKISQKGRRAHVVSWEISNGPVSNGICVLHKCDNPPCVNPAHLWTGTKIDNVEDMVRKGRQATGDRHSSRTHPERVARGDASYAHRNPWIRQGERNGRAKLTVPQVLEIRRMYSEGVPTKQLMGQFGLTRSAMWAVVSRKHWKHI